MEFLTIWTDGFIVHPEMWRDEFLKYDYIGAPWPLPKEGDATTPAVSAAPIEMPSSTGASQFILSNEKNQNYSDTASSVAVQSVKSADKALAKSNAASTPTLVAAVQRSANVGLWFVLVAVILGAIAFVFFLRDRKLSRYSRYVARKKKRATKAELDARW